MTSLGESIRGKTTGLTLGEISSEVGRYLSETNVKRFFESHGQSAFLAKVETDIQDRLEAADAQKRRTVDQSKKESK